MIVWKYNNCDAFAGTKIIPGFGAQSIAYYENEVVKYLRLGLT
jgi:hypothetical protein